MQYSGSETVGAQQPWILEVDRDEGTEIDEPKAGEEERSSVRHWRVRGCLLSSAGRDDVVFGFQFRPPTFTASSRCETKTSYTPQRNAGTSRAPGSPNPGTHAAAAPMRNDQRVDHTSQHPSRAHPRTLSTHTHARARAHAHTHLPTHHSHSNGTAAWAHTWRGRRVPFLLRPYLFQLIAARTASAAHPRTRCRRVLRRAA